MTIAFTPLTLPELPGPGRAIAVDPAASSAGYAAGYAEGLRAAALELEQQRADLAAAQRAVIEDGRREVQARLSALGAATIAMSQRSAPVLDEVVDQLAEGALALAELVLGAELSDHGRAALTAIGRVRDQLDGLARQDARIALSPQDAAALDPETREGLGHPVIADPTLGPGDAVVRFTGGMIDARIGVALEATRAALADARHGVRAVDDLPGTGASGAPASPFGFEGEIA